MARLDGVRVALLESRKAADMSLLVERLGGVVTSAASVREVRRDEDMQPALSGLTAGAFDLVVVLTAAAADALFAIASERGQLEPVVRALQATTIACRGPKPLLTLRKRGLSASITTAKPHTTDELLAALAPVPLAGRRALLLHYGERNDALGAALRARGADVTDAAPYEWALPLDTKPLGALIDDTVQGNVDAMLFTSQIQFRHLLQVARENGREAALIAALRDQVVVGSIGPVCSRVIRAAGVVPDVMPGLPNGPSLVQALADYLSMFNPSEEISS
jgi:uroporphyrinogen-III synthase